ncbi:hypothetical protein [Streptosporangium sp. 'caverna']|uniref:hypothetical protein n=1 Tax=Streptosporangium sp. 'caverna' TaxID=2202249 RepID=UPI000D7E763D|nr:hypothetical protein [Streptosporangium sp. 'caverna']AWS46442.1 hypothetical protein DKM19_39215 [Streptosporangium sp. 'caverna']
MSYDLDRTLYVDAAAVAGMAAIVIPYARPIAFMMTLMIADPAEIQRAAAQWNDKSPVDIGPDPALFSPSFHDSHSPVAAPNGATGDSIAYLRSELGGLARAAGANKEWVGASYDMFMKNFKEFDDQLVLLENRRKGVGDVLHSAADFYHWGALTCTAIAGILMGLVAYISVARLTPTAMAAETMVMRIVTTVGSVMQKIMDAQVKGIMKISVIVAGVAVYYNQQAQSLPGLKAMKGKTPEFTQALSYDTTSGGLLPVVPKVDTDIEQPGVLPNFGW